MKDIGDLSMSESLDMEKTLKDLPIWLSNNYGVLSWDVDIKKWTVTSPLENPEDFSILLETKSFRKSIDFFMKLKAQ
jgi:hypothetical protein